MAALTPHVVLLDDASVSVDESTDGVWIWKGYAEELGRVSVARHLERHAERFRAAYLRFVYDLGESEIGGRRLREHFTTADGFSLWWMHRIEEASPFKCLRLFDCLRLLALEDLLRTSGVRRLTVHSADSALLDATARLCGNLGVTWRGEAASGKSQTPASSTQRRLYDALPQTLQGLLSVRHLLARWSFRALQAAPWFSGPSALFVSSNFYHLDNRSASQGIFHSHQWESLPDWWHRLGGRLNWLHHYRPDLRGVQDALSLAQSFNRTAESQGRHAFLETFINTRRLVRIVAEWLRLVAIDRRIGKDLPALFRPAGSAASLWPFLRDDWKNAMAGTSAVSTCAWYVLFDAALATIPRQTRGVYLFEGLDWEAALLHAWRKHGHGELIAVPHSSMPFWYLSLYEDSRCFGEVPRKPLPDRWALNGPGAWRAFTEAGYPVDRLVEVEALRFMHLQTPAVRPPREGQRLRVLIFGDFTRTQTLRMLRVANDAAALTPAAIEMRVKLHPSCQLTSDEIGAQMSDATGQSVADAIASCDVAFVSNTTSAALDAVCAGVPVIVFLDDEGLNQSPLRGQAQTTFISTAAELAAALSSPQSPTSNASARYFWLDPALPRWRQALAPPARSHD